jgi:hypothetical protein
MLQLIEKILLNYCDTRNDVSTIDCLQRLWAKHSATKLHAEDTSFNRVCCYTIHQLHYMIDNCVGSPTATAERTLCIMLKDILYFADDFKTLRRYLEIDANNIAERVSRYKKICTRHANAHGLPWTEPPCVKNAVKERLCSEVDAIVPVKTTQSTFIEGRQLITIKRVIEQEISMYIDVNIKCPDCIKISMPHLEEPIYISRVIKKYVTFAKLFDGKARENTLLYYYKLNKSDSTLEFIDEDMEQEVADLLGVTLIEKEYVDEEQQMMEYAAKNKLTPEQITAFKQQLDEVRRQLTSQVDQPRGAAVLRQPTMLTLPDSDVMQV